MQVLVGANPVPPKVRVKDPYECEGLFLTVIDLCWLYRYIDQYLLYANPHVPPRTAGLADICSTFHKVPRIRRTWFHNGVLFFVAWFRSSQDRTGSRGHILRVMRANFPNRHGDL